MWDPNYVLSVVKDRDPRIGSCADTGHWVRSGLRPVDCLRILKGRIISSHLKDLNEMGPGAHDVPYGTGVSDIPGILDELKAQGFDGNISIDTNTIGRIRCRKWPSALGSSAATARPRSSMKHSGRARKIAFKLIGMSLIAVVVVSGRSGFWSWRASR